MEGGMHIMVTENGETLRKWNISEEKIWFWILGLVKNAWVKEGWIHNTFQEMDKIERNKQKQAFQIIHVT